jgi:hypothetical protein
VGGLSNLFSAAGGHLNSAFSTSPGAAMRATDLAWQYGTPGNVPANIDLAGPEIASAMGGGAALPSLAAVPGGAGFGSAAGGAASQLGVAAVPGGITNAAVTGAGSSAAGGGAGAGLLGAAPAAGAALVGALILNHVMGTKARKAERRADTARYGNEYISSFNSGYVGDGLTSNHGGDFRGDLNYAFSLLNPGLSDIQNYAGVDPSGLTEAGMQNARQTLYNAKLAELSSPQMNLPGGEGGAVMGYYDPINDRWDVNQAAGYGSPAYQAALEADARAYAGLLDAVKPGGSAIPQAMRFPAMFG